LEARWPGRLQWIKLNDVNILIDGAHNKAGALQLRNFIDKILAQKPQPITWVIGVTQGKDLNSILKILIRSTDHVICVPFATPEGMRWINCWKTGLLKEKILELVPNVLCYEEENLTKAIEKISHEKENRLTIISGSLYLLAELFKNFNDVWSLNP